MRSDTVSLVLGSALGLWAGAAVAGAGSAGRVVAALKAASAVLRGSLGPRRIGGFIVVCL